MDKLVPQLIGVIVTMIVVLGCDRYGPLSAALGITAGACATYRIAAGNGRRALKEKAVRP